MITQEEYYLLLEKVGKSEKVTNEEMHNLKEFEFFQGDDRHKIQDISPEDHLKMIEVIKQKDNK